VNEIFHFIVVAAVVFDVDHEDIDESVVPSAVAVLMDCGAVVKEECVLLLLLGEHGVCCECTYECLDDFFMEDRLGAGGRQPSG